MARAVLLHRFTKRNKYGVSSKDRRTVDGITFDSLLEMRVYLRLKREQEDGRVLFILRQVPFHLPGKTKYVCDFQVFNADGTVEFIDAKGMETETFRLKHRQTEALYPVEIKLVKK